MNVHLSLKKQLHFLADGRNPSTFKLPVLLAIDELKEVPTLKNVIFISM